MSERLMCEWCGGTFHRGHERGPVPKYCSNSHRQQAYQARRSLRWATSPAVQQQIQAAEQAVRPGTALSDVIASLNRSAVSTHVGGGITEALAGMQTTLAGGGITEALAGMQTTLAGGGITEALAGMQTTLAGSGITEALAGMQTTLAGSGITEALAAINQSYTLAIPDLLPLAGLADSLATLDLDADLSKLLAHVRSETQDLQDADAPTRLVRTPVVVGALGVILVAVLLRGALSDLGEEAAEQATITVEQMFRLVDALGANRRLAGLLILWQLWTSTGSRPAKPG